MTQDNFANFFFLLLFAGVPLVIFLIYHHKTFMRYLPILIKINVFSFILWIVGGNISYKHNIWEVTYSGILNGQLFGILVGDIFQSIIGTTILGFVTILTYEAYEKKKRFRDIALQRE